MPLLRSFPPHIPPGTRCRSGRFLFPTIGHTMIFLFDYGDGWHFRVKLQEVRTRVAKVRYPRVVAARGEAPRQYTSSDADHDAPTYGINPVTGEKIIFGS